MRPEFKLLTSVLRVPVLQHGGEVVCESHAILRYLARKTIAAQVDVLMEFGSATLYAVHWVVLPKRPHDTATAGQNRFCSSCKCAER